LAFNHVTIPVGLNYLWANRNFELESSTITNVGVSMAVGHTSGLGPEIRAGFTPPGDEQLQVYHHLLGGILCPGLGLSWSGSSRIKSNIFLVLNWRNSTGGFLYLTWSTA